MLLKLKKISELKREKELAKFCMYHKTIWLYGAGYVCRKMLGYLSNTLGIRPEGILVTKLAMNPDNVDGISVFDFESKKDEIDENTGIIICVGYWKCEEIIEELKKSHINISNIYLQNIYENYLFDRKVIIKKSIEEGFFSKYKELNDYGKNYGTDKSSESLNYLNKYDFFLNGIKDSEQTILELGIYRGSSLKMWRDYFSLGKVIGADINPQCKEFQDLKNQIYVKIGDLGNISFLNELGKCQPTIILDDASHKWSHQIIALYQLFPMLKNGGIYILEDTVTSFSMWENERYNDIDISTFEFLQLVATVVSSGEPLRKIDVKQGLEVLAKEAEELAKDIEAITFIHGSCVIVKR